MPFLSAAAKLEFRTFLRKSGYKAEESQRENKSSQFIAATGTYDRRKKRQYAKVRQEIYFAMYSQNLAREQAQAVEMTSRVTPARVP
jgi:hypothetical protein